MEYATEIAEEFRDDNYFRYIGWKGGDDYIKKYFSDKTVRVISAKITDLLTGVDPHGRPILIPDKTILSVMSEIYKSYRPPVGDIHSRYIIPTKEGPYSYIQEMIDRTIEIIVSDLKNSFGMKYNNESLSIWTTVYGDFNAHKLRQHGPIKVVNKRPDPMQFFQNY